MGLLICLVIAVLFSWFLRKPIKQYPVIFYALALLISALGIYFTWFPVSDDIVRAITFSIQKGHLGFAFFTVVMFVGVFDAHSTIRRGLNPVRAKLSIIGSILIIAHFVPYLRGYLSMLGSLFSFRMSIVFSFFVAIILLVLLVALTVTSFDAIKRRMASKSWKTLQRLAYVFFVLIFIHLAGFLVNSFLQGTDTVLISGTTYMVILLLYAVLRIRRYLIDRKSASEMV